MAIEVSTKWKDAIQAQFRYPAHIQLTLDVQPPGLREGAQVETDVTESITSTDSIFDGLRGPIEPVATFEPDRWIGDGSMYLPSEDTSLNKPLEWWSNNCGFTEVQLTLLFDQVYTIPGMYIAWDTETNSWPTKLNLKGYNQEGTLINTYDITTINSPTYYFDAVFSNVKKIDMTITEWSKPNWRVRITEITCGVFLQFDNNKVSQASLNASTNLISSELPKLSVKFDINNYDKFLDPLLKEGYSKFLAERQLVSVTWGFSVDNKTIEWMKPWSLYLNTWQIPTDSQTMQVTAGSRLSFLTNKYVKGLYTGSTKTFKTLALEVLQNSDIIKNSDTEIPWELDDILDTLYTRAPAPSENVNAVLQLIANATGCILDINPVNNNVRIRSSCATTDYTITKLQQLGDPAYTISNKLKSIKVGLRTFSPKTTTEQVYKFEGRIAGKYTLNIDYNSNNIVNSPTASITGATIVSQQYFARHAIIVINTSSTTEKDVVLTISGKVVEESTMYIQTYNDADVVSGDEIVIDNPLITEIATLNRIAEVAKNYFLRRKTAEVTYIGYPELETGDTLSFVTNYGDFNADVSKLTLDFNGGFEGTLEVLTEE